MVRRRKVRGVSAAIGLGLALGLSSGQRAHAHSLLDGMEHVFGATNVHAVSGHGRLTIGVARDGDLTVLAWPNPSHADQLALITSNAFDARDRARFGAAPGTGAFLGIAIERASGARAVHWLHDPAEFIVEQDYGAADGPNVETRFASQALGLSVTVIDAVDPKRDVLVRAARVEREPGADIVQAWLLTYANLSPVPPTSRISRLPIVDWLWDGRNDFAAIWDEDAGAVIAFHPEDQRVHRVVGDLLVEPKVSWGTVGAALQAGTPDGAALAALAAGLDASYAPGAYLALTTVPAPDQHQIGYDATPLCDTVDEWVDNLLALAEKFPDRPLPIDPGLLGGVRCDRNAPSIKDAQGWTHDALDAFSDAADGELSGSGIAAGEVNEALRTPLVFSGDVASASVILAAGPDAASVRALLAQATAPESVSAAAEAALDGFLADLRLPTTGDASVVRTARRSVINVRVGTVQENGAIVASIARQAPYGVDWPRDGMFFNVLLDVTGQHELAERRTELYQSWQRAEPSPPLPVVDLAPPPNPDGSPGSEYPAGGWEMNYFPDGMIGGPFRFEIDNTAFAVFMLVAHVGWVEPERRQDYLRSRWDAIQRGADLLAHWRDPETGLQAPAQEDDNAEYTRGLHGAVTVVGALDIAARAARAIGEAVTAEAWEARARELQKAILTHLYDPAARRFVSSPGAAVDPAHPPTGQTAWAVWPMQLLPWDDPRLREQLKADLVTIRPTVDLETEGGSYFAKTLVSAAVMLGQDPDVGPEVARMRDALAAHATPETLHFGEVMLVRKEDGTPRADQRVSTPHLWAGTLFFLTAMGMEDAPELSAWDDALPPSRVVRSEPDAGESGGCSASGGALPDRTPLFWYAAALAALALLRRARQA